MQRGRRTRLARSPRAALTAAAACVAVVGLTGCFNAITVTDAGRVGVTVDAAGKPVLLVMLCDKGTANVQLAEGRKESDPATKQNVERGAWTAVREFRGVRELSLSRPGALWTPANGAGNLDPEGLLIAEGGTEEDDTASLVPVDFRPANLVRLAPGKVLTSDGTVSRARFGRYTCQD
jgi:hypothetical protein